MAFIRWRENLPHNAVVLAKQLKSRMNLYGNQADDKKYHQSTCRPGAWKGEIIHTDQPFPRKSSTGKKWQRFRSGVHWVLEQAALSLRVPTDELRRIVDLGVNVTDVYKDARCYLKGFRNLDGWWTQEDSDGPPLPSEFLDPSSLSHLDLDTDMNSAEWLELEDALTLVAHAGYPLLTSITSELVAHCEALADLFEAEEPMTVFLCPSSSNKFRYYIGDASREGLGRATQYPDDRIAG